METAIIKITDFFDEFLKDRKNTTFILGSGVCLIIVSYLFKSYINKRNYFKKQNLPGPAPWPMLGNFIGTIRNGLVQNDKIVMEKYGKTIGYFEGSIPVVMTIDPKLIKTICIKDFGSFTNRRVTNFFFNIFF